jgi:hypothetical protein
MAHTDPQKARACRVRQMTHRRLHPEGHMVSAAKYRAKQQRVPFDLQPDDINVPEFCPILGIKLERNYSGKTGGHQDCSPSLDRIRPDEGYVKGNVWVISNRANRIKNDGTLEEHRLIVSALEKVSHV